MFISSTNRYHINERYNSVAHSLFSCLRWKSRSRLGYLRKTSSFTTGTGVVENSEHPLIYDDAAINYISNGAVTSANHGLQRQLVGTSASNLYLMHDVIRLRQNVSLLKQILKFWFECKTHQFLNISENIREKTRDIKNP